MSLDRNIMNLKDIQFIDRMADVYEASSAVLDTDEALDRQMSELEGTYSLHFHQWHTGGRLGMALKRVFLQTTRPLLGRQVKFNQGVTRVLAELRSRLDGLTERAEGRLPRNMIEARMQAGLYFGDAIRVDLQENGTVRWVATETRVVEEPFVVQTLARLDSSPMMVLFLGGEDTLLPYLLAGLGYQVTVMGRHLPALSHPNLKLVLGDLDRPVFSPGTFDCVVGLFARPSEQLAGHGLGSDAIRRIHALLKPGGHALLTLPYGSADQDFSGRIYDGAALEALVQPFARVTTRYAVHRDSLTWVTTDEEPEAAGLAYDSEAGLPGAVALLAGQKV